MARKPSRIAWPGCAVLSIVVLSMFAGRSSAQSGVQVSSPAAVITNQFAAGGSAAPAQAQTAAPAASSTDEPFPFEAERPSRGPTLYRNPFSGAPLSPSLSVPLRAGSISRWQRNDAPQATSPAPKTSLGAAPLPLVGTPSNDSVGRAAVNWDRLPPVDDMRAMRATQNTAINVPSAPFTSAPQAASPPDPVKFAATNLSQPTWMMPEQSATIATSANSNTSTNTHSLVDPFELPEVNAAKGSEVTVRGVQPNEPAAFGPPGATTMLQPVETQQLDLKSPDMLPVIISDIVDSAEGCYDQAETMARTAATADEFASVAEVCQQGLRMGSTAESTIPLRRLAAWAHNRCGEVLVDEGQADKALGHFQSAVGFDANCALAIHNRGVTLAQQGKTADALRDFNRVIDINPGLAVAYRNRAELLTSLGRVDEAIRDFDRAIEQLGDDPDLYRARAYARQRSNKFDEALADLNTAIRLSPRDAGSFTQRGGLAAERGDFEQAIGDYRRAIDLDPNYAEAYRGLAWLLATCPDSQLRDGKQSLALALTAVQLAPPRDCMMLDALAAAYAANGQFDDAVKAAQQALAAAPAQLSPPMRQRLSLYQQGKTFTTRPANGVRTVSHESPGNSSSATNKRK